MLEFEPPDDQDIIAVQLLPDGARFGKASTWLPSIEVVEYQRQIAALVAEVEQLREQLAAVTEASPPPAPPAPPAPADR